MYILHNAMKNLARNKGRNILLGAVTLAIIVSAVVTLTTNNAAARIIEDERLDIGSKVEISQDLMKMYTSGTQYQELGIDDYLSYADSDYLKHTIFNVEVPMYSADILAIDDEYNGQQTIQMDDGTTVMMPTLKLVGSSDADSLADFGTLRQITEGGMFEGTNECIISADLAQGNNLSVGDTISIESIFKPIQQYELKIVGIYSDETSAYGDFTYQKMAYINKRNEIITSFDTVMAKGYQTNAGIDMKAEYYLKNPDQLPKFEEEVRAKGLPDAYDVDINQAAYGKVVGPLARLKGVSVAFMMVVLMLGALILVLISSIAIRERRYEVGVLRAMGMEKGKIAFGILAEAVMIAAICLCLGLVAGSAVAEPVADDSLKGQVAAAAESSASDANKLLMANGQTMVGNGTNDYQPISEIQVALGTDTLVQIIVVAVGLAALSSVVGIIRITQYEPMKILMERN